MTRRDAEKWFSQVLRLALILVEYYRDLGAEVEAYRHRIIVDSIACLTAMIVDLYLKALSNVAKSSPEVQKQVLNTVRSALLSTLPSLIQSPTKSVIGAFLKRVASIREVMAEVATQLDERYGAFEEVHAILSRARRLFLPSSVPCIATSITIGTALFFLMPWLYTFAPVPLLTNVSYVAIASALVPLTTIAMLMLTAYAKRRKAQSLLQKLGLVCREYLEL